MNPGWWRVCYVATCCAVLAADTDRLPNLPGWWWSTMYATAAVALLAWKFTGRHCLLSTFGALMFSATGVRAVTLALEGRAAGAALNCLVAYWILQVVIYRPVAVS